jgi:hypothetical protein
MEETVSIKVNQLYIKKITFIYEKFLYKNINLFLRLLL